MGGLSGWGFGRGEKGNAGNNVPETLTLMSLRVEEG